MMRTAALALISMLTATQALAADVPPGADRILWCGSAFYWLAADAADAGNEAEADQYGTWSDTLLAEATDLLEAAGFDQEALDATVGTYDTDVVAEMATPVARYDVTACPELVAPPAQ